MPKKKSHIILFSITRSQPTGWLLHFIKTQVDAYNPISGRCAVVNVENNQL